MTVYLDGISDKSVSMQEGSSTLVPFYFSYKLIAGQTITLRLPSGGPFTLLNSTRHQIMIKREG